MKKLKKLIFNLTSVTIITGFIFLVSVTSAFAHYYSYGYSLYSMSYKVKNDTGSWYFDQAAQNWGNAVGTNIYTSGNSSNNVSLDNLAYNWYGKYYPSISGGKVYYFTIRVNNTSLARDYGDGQYASWQSIVSTATHEFGHAQYLADLEDGWGDASIMSYERDRDITYKPKSHDITDIKNMR